MPESYVQLPPDSTGKKLRTRQKTVGANTVEEQATYQAAQETWSVWVEPVVPAANKQFLSIFNGVGSGKTIRVKKIYCVNMATAATAGAYVRFDIKRTTGQSGGTAISTTGNATGALTPLDTNNVAIPAQVLIAAGATSVTEGNILFPWITITEEMPLTQPLTNTMFQQAMNIIPEGLEIQEICLREGQGMTIKQITNVTAGSLGWIAVITVE